MQKTALIHFLTGSSGNGGPTHPFTHHEILELIAPFSRSGRQVDLEASDRLNRRLLFKPIEHHDDTAPQTQMREILQLENTRPHDFRLTRTLTLPCGLTASLHTEGRHPGELLARIEAWTPQRHFRRVGEVVIALDYRLDPVGEAALQQRPVIRPVLVRAEARIADINLVLNASTVKGYPAEIDLTDADGDDLDLPDDFLAVLGYGWGPLRRNGKGWRGNLRVPGDEAERTRRIEAKLDVVVTHLARTLAQPPRLFHDSLRRARWKVVLRRALPLLFFGGLIVGSGALTFVNIPQDSIFNLMLMGMPPLLLFGAFGVRDRPPLEVPPLPRRLKATAWRKSRPPAPEVVELTEQVATIPEQEMAMAMAEEHPAAQTA
jgi:hypothetical protein